MQMQLAEEWRSAGADLLVSCSLLPSLSFSARRRYGTTVLVHVHSLYDFSLQIVHDCRCCRAEVFHESLKYLKLVRNARGCSRSVATPT